MMMDGWMYIYLCYAMYHFRLNTKEEEVLDVYSCLLFLLLTGIFFLSQTNAFNPDHLNSTTVTRVYSTIKAKLLELRYVRSLQFLNMGGSMKYGAHINK